MVVSNKSGDTMTTIKLQLFGKVQGVGMRFYVSRTASQYNLNGYVKNKSDGSVECVLQGSKTVIEAMIHHIQEKHPGTINRIKKSEVEEPKEYRKFSISLF
jgi:acylphosphatase